MTIRGQRESGILSRPMRMLVRDYEWIHIGLGLIGNTSFLVGSVLFLWEGTKLAGIWLFIIGALGMLVGSIGAAIVRYEERRLPAARADPTGRGG